MGMETETSGWGDAEEVREDGDGHSTHARTEVYIHAESLARALPNVAPRFANYSITLC